MGPATRVTGRRGPVTSHHPTGLTSHHPTGLGPTGAVALRWARRGQQDRRLRQSTELCEPAAIGPDTHHFAELDRVGGVRGASGLAGLGEVRGRGAATRREALPADPAAGSQPSPVTVPGPNGGRCRPGRERAGVVPVERPDVVPVEGRQVSSGGGQGRIRWSTRAPGRGQGGMPRVEGGADHSSPVAGGRGAQRRILGGRCRAASAPRRASPRPARSRSRRSGPPAPRSSSSLVGRVDPGRQPAVGILRQLLGVPVLDDLAALEPQHPVGGQDVVRLAAVDQGGATDDQGR